MNKQTVNISQNKAKTYPPHPRTIGWFGTTSVAAGAFNQSLFLMSVLFIGQGSIPGQGSACVPLMIVALLLSWAATPGWTELLLMYPNRVGGIAATCAEAFRPYSPVLAALTGVCYWWGWMPASGLTAWMAASVLHDWCIPWIPVSVQAVAIVLFYTVVNLCGVKWAMRSAMPTAIAAGVLAFLSGLIPVLSGHVDWHQAFTYHLTVPFPGWFGKVTSIMAGIYLIGYLAPAFEQAGCHVGETINAKKNVPRAMFLSAGLASIYFIFLPIIWLGALGAEPLGRDLAQELGPTFAPWFGAAGKGLAAWFMVLNMLQCVLAPLAGAPRTLAQLAEDGLLPESLALRNRADAPWVATLLTTVGTIICMFMGDPLWLIAAANLTYLISICMPSVAVWLLRKNEPQVERPYRAPRGTITLGLVAAVGWALTTVLGFEQFGLPTVVVSIVFAYAGAGLYAWRKGMDRRKAGLPFVAQTLHLKLTGAMVAVLAFDAVGYLIAVSNVPERATGLVTMLADIFVIVALLTISVGIVLPGMIAHSADEVSKAAKHLVESTLSDFTRAMHALAAGDLSSATARFQFAPVHVHTRDEVGEMAQSFNRLQEEIGLAVVGLEGAREGLWRAREVTEANVRLQIELVERRRSEEQLREQAALLDKASDAILLGDLENRILYLNPKAERFYGWTRAELTGMPSGAPIYKDAAVFAKAKQALMERGEWSGDMMQIAKDGHELMVESRWTLLHDAEGNPKSILFINTDISERKQAEATLEAINKQMRELSHQAGMAEVATGVLHNVGNVLNSVNISTSIVCEKLQRSVGGLLVEIANVFRAQDGNLAEFLTNDPRGKQIPQFIGKLSDRYLAERETILAELDLLRRNIVHIKDIVAMQQNYARVSGVSESLQVSNLLENALDIHSAALCRHRIEVERDFQPVPDVQVDKHKVLQILVNVIHNAKYAMDAGGNDRRVLKLSVGEGRDSFVRVKIEDSGIGIEPANLTRIFAHGFTTRADGHGFGLHSSANAAREMGGGLTAHSEGIGKGATFTLELPVEPLDQN